MITKINLKDVLKTIGFEKKGNVLEKFYPEYNCFMKADFKKEKLIYPDNIIGRDRNTSFVDPENFVVFECVDKLLTKGYRPEHIELEKEWHLGHEQKSGRADICVYNQTKDEMLFIIECKTAGREYQKAYNDTLNDGAQLFSYWQQEHSTKWLALYNSDFKDGEVTYDCPVISCVDDPNIKELSKNDNTVLLYETAYTVEEKYRVWKETYLNQLYDNLIFDNETIAYNIGVKPLLKKNLKNFTPTDKIVNQFEEILRHNNVSDKENAFNRLIALFICKLVDEISKGDNDEVDFQYKQGTDTYESLQDRLQRLHQKGMKEFMKEEIFYVENDYAEKLFAQFTGVQRKNAIENLNQTIRILKFYSNNDFTFKDVHNKELFYQNGKILVEVIMLFQKYRIVYPCKHQFLGDLFEQLLNKGFKQNEGQFFTPIPLTRFIWDSLPLEKVMNYKDDYHFPRVIDYACGAGHFLTEGVEAINNYYENKNYGKTVDNTWVEKHIYGIEKDYRLARVSKVSMFMNGAGGANIIFGDGLENYSEKEIAPKSFDILVANPPYSVSSFKSHMKLKNNDFKLLSKISNDGSEIETLFVERISQLVKSAGIVGVILPSSILSNNSNSYIGAREEILKHFYIRAITCFGSKTFGATGTNTVVMFLEKMKEPPLRFKLVEDGAENILSGEETINWEDDDIFESYLEQIQLDKETYITFAKESKDYSYFKNIKYFKNYFEAFMKLPNIRTKITNINFRRLPLKEQSKWINKEFYNYVKAKEKDKLIYFSMVYRQTVLIITAPNNNEEQKEFLGYDWSNRKGNEGIVINKAGGMLYDDENRYNENTLAGLVRSSYNEEYRNLKGYEKYYHYANLKDMIDFTGIEFNKSIATTVNKKVEVKSKYKLVNLSEFPAEISKGTSITKSNTTEGKYKVVAGGISYAYTHNKYNREKNIITVSASGANAGYVNFWSEKIFASDCTTIKGKSLIETLYIYNYLCSIPELINNLKRGAAQPHVYPKDLEKIKIPVPPLNIKKKIVYECKEIDEKYNMDCKKIEQYKNKIENLFKDVEELGEETIRLNSSDFTLGIGKRILKSQISAKGIPIYSANVKEPFGLTENKFFDNFSIPTVIWGIDGDWDVNYIAPNIPFYPTDHCGTLRVNNKNINPIYISFALKSVGEKQRFSRSNRASINRIGSLRLTIPPIDKQNEFASKVQQISKKIAELENTMQDIKDKKKDILKKYL